MNQKLFIVLLVMFFGVLVPSINAIPAAAPEARRDCPELPPFCAGTEVCIFDLNTQECVTKYYARKSEPIFERNNFTNGNSLHKAAKKHNELLQSAFMAQIGSQYKSNQLVFLDKSLKDECTISQGYGYSVMNTRAVQKELPQMNTFPYTRSVLILDNASIYYNKELIEYFKCIWCAD
ncbi:hypothetical protein C2G38_2222809 [Gigaspora rosea]|uniref:Uncharacterized protein n=1 Tax=Gigaspora rosea TaxID=44941 RepID=A0A397UAV8_9GLOM|nr:hypothetical protein C2G38_2222809 [Gigaspora rosea]